MRLLVATVLLAVLLAPAPLRADPVAEAVTQLPVEIVHLRVGGSWQGDDGAAGYQRYVVARTEPGSRAARMFVQWIMSAEGQADTLVATSEIVELAETPHQLTDFQVVVEEDGTTLHLETIELETGVVGGLAVFLEGPGAYTASPAAN